MKNYNYSESEYCSISASKLLTKLGMVSLEMVIDYEDYLRNNNIYYDSTNRMYFKIKYEDALSWLSENYGCDILIYWIGGESWKARILPGGPVYDCGLNFSDEVSSSWSMIADLAIITVCSKLVEDKKLEY